MSPVSFLDLFYDIYSQQWIYVTFGFVEVNTLSSIFRNLDLLTSVALVSLLIGSFSNRECTGRTPARVSDQLWNRSTVQLSLGHHVSPPLLWAALKNDQRVIPSLQLVPTHSQGPTIYRYTNSDDGQRVIPSLQLVPTHSQGPTIYRYTNSDDGLALALPR
jgi:hypothetical protein